MSLSKKLNKMSEYVNVEGKESENESKRKRNEDVENYIANEVKKIKEDSSAATGNIQISDQFIKDAIQSALLSITNSANIPIAHATINVPTAAPSNLVTNVNKSLGLENRSNNMVKVLPIVGDGSDTYVEVAQDKVGQIIGSKGGVIAELQKLSGTTVYVEQNIRPGIAQVKISGNHSQKETAIEFLKKICELGAQAGLVYMAGCSGVQTVMDCPHALVGRVIGSGGTTIKEIQQRSGAKVQIDQDMPEGVPRKLTISGAPESVPIAMQLITYVMENGPILPPAQNAYASVAYSAQPSAYASPYMQPAPAMVQGKTSHASGSGLNTVTTKTLQIAKEFVGRLIGKKGENILAIGQKAGCNIKILQDTDPCSALITGPMNGIAIAENLILDTINKIKTGQVYSIQALTSSTVAPMSAYSQYQIPQAATMNHYASLMQQQYKQPMQQSSYMMQTPQSMAGMPSMYAQQGLIQQQGNSCV